MLLHEVFVEGPILAPGMNAGGVLNTCKSNGIHQALLGGEEWRTGE